MRLARGGWADALTSYDKNLRVRWSEERGKWCVEVKVKRRDQLPAPVKWGESKSGLVVRERLAENSDISIGYRDGYHAILWAPEINSQVYAHIVARDTERFPSREAFLDFITEKLRTHDKDRSDKAAKISKERAEQAYDKYRYLHNRAPWGSPFA